MVGKDITQNELLPIYDKFLESNDNYEQKLAIKNLPQILIKVDKKVKERYYKYFEPVSIFIDNTGNKVRNFNFLNWKNKLNVIEGILCYYNLYDNDIIYKSILPQCISFSLDKYYKVRKTSSKVLATLLLYLYQQNYKKDQIIKTIKNFAFHKKFKIRINFIKFLPVFFQDKDFYNNEIKNIIKVIVMKDKILDVKIALAKVLKKIINNEKEPLNKDEYINKFCFILNKNKVINKIFEDIKILETNDKIEDNLEDKNYFVEDNKYFSEEFKLDFEKKNTVDTNNQNKNDNNTENDEIKEENKKEENDKKENEKEEDKEEKKELEEDKNINHSEAVDKKENKENNNLEETNDKKDVIEEKNEEKEIKSIEEKESNKENESNQVEKKEENESKEEVKEEKYEENKEIEVKENENNKEESNDDLKEIKSDETS
jgi:hypothetical protein